jgi:hypothetical protein
VTDKVGRSTWNGMSIAWYSMPVLGRFLPLGAASWLAASFFFFNPTTRNARMWPALAFQCGAVQTRPRATPALA